MDSNILNPTYKELIAMEKYRYAENFGIIDDFIPIIKELQT